MIWVSVPLVMHFQEWFQLRGNLIMQDRFGVWRGAVAPYRWLIALYPVSRRLWKRLRGRWIVEFSTSKQAIPAFITTSCSWSSSSGCSRGCSRVSPGNRHWWGRLHQHLHQTGYSCTLLLRFGPGFWSLGIDLIRAPTLLLRLVSFDCWTLTELKLLEKWGSLNHRHIHNASLLSRI